MTTRSALLAAKSVSVVELPPGRLCSAPDALVIVQCSGTDGSVTSEHVVRCGSFREALDVVTSALHKSESSSLFKLRSELINKCVKASEGSRKFFHHATASADDAQALRHIASLVVDSFGLHAHRSALVAKEQARRAQELLDPAATDARLHDHGCYAVARAAFMAQAAQGAAKAAGIEATLNGVGAAATRPSASDAIRAAEEAVGFARAARTALTLHLCKLEDAKQIARAANSSEHASPSEPAAPRSTAVATSCGSFWSDAPTLRW